MHPLIIGRFLSTDKERHIRKSTICCFLSVLAELLQKNYIFFKKGGAKIRNVCYDRCMGKKIVKLSKCIVVYSLAACMMAAAFSDVFVASATSIDSIQNQIKEDQNKLDQLNDKISNLSDEQNLIEEEIADLESEAINMMTSISMKEDEIAEKENAIAQKKVEIGHAQIDYEKAKVKAEEQYEAMKVQIRFMYENGDTSLLAMLFSSADFSDFLNRADYAEKIYQYSQNLLGQYEEARDEVQALWNRLEADKEELELDQVELEKDLAVLEELRAELKKQLAKLEAQSADYNAKIASFKKQADAAKKQLQKDQKELKKLQEEQKKAAEAAANKSSGSSSSSTSSSSSASSAIQGASGSELGKKIAEYACQFIGNPYVYGGTSLTNGTDCSGFTYSVYKNFGYTLPRTSFEQRSAGKSVSYSEAQPGDLICYSGHVAMYIGNGMIVHASTAKTGIIISKATYKTILAVRRII